MFQAFKHLKNFQVSKIFQGARSLAYSDRVRWPEEDPETYLFMTTVDGGCRDIIEGCRGNLGGCRDIERGVNLSRLLLYYYNIQSALQI
jgi:hypothetical protein